MAQRTVLITSFKGGVGKSTVSANLAVALAAMGKKVLAVDCDFKMRCLDLIFGCEDRVLYDLSDYFEGRMPLSKVLLSPETCENITLAPAPYECDGELTEENWRAFLNEPETKAFDYILFDTPGEAGGQMLRIAPLCGTALVIANPHATSIRAAEKTAMTLQEAGVSDRFLLVNAYENKKGDASPSLLSIIDRTAVRLLGLIPLDRTIPEKQDRGLFPEASGLHASNAGIAFANIAKRLEGRSVPLASGFRGIDRRKYIK